MAEKKGNNSFIPLFMLQNKLASLKLWDSNAAIHAVVVLTVYTPRNENVKMKQLQIKPDWVSFYEQE